MIRLVQLLKIRVILLRRHAKRRFANAPATACFIDRTGGYLSSYGKKVICHGYVGIPSILIKAQRRLGITPLQMNIIIQLLDYWWTPDRRPFPSKKELAERIGVTPKTIQTNIKTLEEAGLVRREQRRANAGDWNSNIYHLDGLVKRIQGFELDFAEARDKRKQARRRAETPIGLRRPVSQD